MCAQAAAQEQFPYLADVTSKGVNVRAGQSSGFEKVGRLGVGDKVVVVDKEYSWYKIKLPVNAESYVSSAYVQDLGQGVGQITGNRVNIRSGAHINFSVIGQVKKGEWIKILQKYPAGHNKAGWYKIEPAEGSCGWVSEKFLKFNSKQIPPSRKVQPPVKNIYELRRIAKKKKAKEEAESLRLQKEKEAKLAEERKLNVSTIGVIESLGDKTLSSNVRHRLIVEGNMSYYLKGYRSIIDGFLNHKVKIEGKIQKNIAADRPVIFVSRIKLVL